MTKVKSTFSGPSQSNWENRYVWTSLLALVAWILALVGQWTYYTHDGWGYGILVMVPVFLLIPPIQILLCGLTAYRWEQWADRRKRSITLASSLGTLVSLLVLIYLRLI